MALQTERGKKEENTACNHIAVFVMYHADDSLHFIQLPEYPLVLVSLKIPLPT